MPTVKIPEINPALSFQFLYVQDNGPCDGWGGSACCPHCGAEGRYIYYWAEFGKVYGAMAGCFKALTGKLATDDISKFMVILAEKQAKGKPLNSWQKTVVRMQEFIAQGKYSVEWCEEKIREAVSSQKSFAASKWGGR